MGRRKIEIKHIEDDKLRRTTFSRRRIDLFKKADALAKLGNVELGVLVISSNNLPYTYGNPCFDQVVERIQNPNGSSILKSQAKLDGLLKELEQIKEHEEVLRKRQQKNQEIVDLKFEDLVALKGKLEAFQADSKRKYVEMEALSSPLMISKNRDKKKKIRTEPSSGQSSSGQNVLPKRKEYELRPRIPRNYIE